MAKKKKDVALSLQDLITQPRQLAHLPMMNKITGYRVLIAVLQRMQGLWRIAKMSEETGNAQGGQLYMNFVTNDFEVKRENTSQYGEGDVVFQLRLSDIESDNHYDEARQALASLLHVKCIIPDENNPGYYATESLMNIRGRRDNGKFVGTEFEVIIPRRTAENILDINLMGGFTRFLSYTAMRLRSSFSYPLYIYLSEEWRHHGEQFVISIDKLRFRLGFINTADDPEREQRYIHWSQFCNKVLDQAKKELKDLAASGSADFTFEYEGLLHGLPLPSHKRPDAVRFTIYPTETGKKLTEANAYTPLEIQAKRLMRDFFNLTEGQCRKLLRRANPSNINALLEQLQTWTAEIQAGKRHDIKSLPKWAYVSIDNFLPQETPTKKTAKEEVIEIPVQEEVQIKQDTVKKEEQTLTSSDSLAIYSAITALKEVLPQEDFYNWAQPVIARNTCLDGKTLVVKYTGPFYKGKHARQSQAFLTILDTIRKATENRIEDIRAIHELNNNEYTL